MKVSKVFETENVLTWGGLEPPTFGFMPNSLTYWAIRARHLLSHFLYIGSGGIDILEVKLTFEMLTVRAGNTIHFRHTSWCSCESVKVFETQNVSTWGELEPPTFEFVPNALTFWAIRARHLLSHVLNTGSGGIDIFEVKLTYVMLAVRDNSIHFWHTNTCSCESECEMWIY